MLLEEEKKLRTLIREEVKKVLNEGSRTTGYTGGNNSTRWTPPGKEKRLDDVALTGYEQVEFPVAQDPVSGGYPETDSREELHIDKGMGVAFNNKIRVDRDEEGNLYFVHQDDTTATVGRKDTVSI